MLLLLLLFAAAAWARGQRVKWHLRSGSCFRTAGS